MKNHILVDASEVQGEIDRNIYGHFVENMARCVYGGILRNERPGHVRGPWEVREEVVEMTRSIRPPVIRWPGGLYADGYIWRDGIGPYEARPLKRNRYWSRYGPFTRVLDPNWFGTHEFMEFVGRVRAEPYVNVNLGTGSALEAARWVEYMNGSDKTLEGRRRASNGRKTPWRVKYWGIGNEIYGFWALGHTGPGEYARRYLEFKRAMEKKDGDLCYVGVGADPYLSKKWNRRFLEQAGDEVDLLSIHIYLPGMERLAGVEVTRLLRGSSGMYRAIVAAPLEIERRLVDISGELKEVMGEKAPPIALDEWNLWWAPQQLLLPRWKLRDALFVSGVLHVLHRLSDFVKMANIAQLVNVLGVLAAGGDRVHRTAIYYPFFLYGSLAGPLRLKTRIKCGGFDSPKVGGIPAMSRVPYLDCSGTLSADGDALVLFVINRHVSDAIRAQVETKEFLPAPNVTAHELSGPSPGAMNSYGDDEVVSIRKERVAAADLLEGYSFPAHSVTALVFQRS